MKNSLLFLFALLLPQLASAQLFKGNPFEAGSYVLADTRTVRHAGELKLRNSKLLLAKDATGKNLKFNPEQVCSFHAGSRKFITTGGFHVKGGIGGLDVEKVFVEQLDSGQVMLLNYELQMGAPMSMGPGGAITGGGNGTTSIYLLQWPDEETATPIQTGLYSSGGKQFRETLQPFFMVRPDLLKLLTEKRININNLAEAVHALNHNLPFTPSAALNLE